MDKSSVNALLLDIAKGCILEVDLGASIDFTSVILSMVIVFIIGMTKCQS